MPKQDFMTLGEGIELPRYDRSKLRPRLIHLGFGAFARAHWMSYHQDFLHKHDGSDWGVVVSDILFGADRFGQLEENDHLYSVLEHSDSVSNMRVIGSILGTAHPERGGVEAFFAPYLEPDLAIVSMTVTEKGYCLSAGKLDESNEAIQHDLANRHTPKTAIGALVEALYRRRAAGLDGFTILSLDNLPMNGKLCEAAVMAFAHKVDPDLANWISAHVTFPCSMVDRIVPALNDESRSLIRDRLGFDDANGIVCEPFRQWVIEEKFIKGRPGWEEAGAQFVEDVIPFEEMKLRMLNGAHSFLAYLGYLGGYKTISDCMMDESYKAAAHQLMVVEQLPTLSVPGDVDLPSYADALIARFSNSQLKHQTAQIASDGSQKLPQRMLESIGWHVEKAKPWPRLAMGVAGWLRYMKGVDDQGGQTPINDPMAGEIAALAQSASEDVSYVSSMLALDTIFPASLVQNPAFVAEIQTAYANLARDGARACVAALVSD